jgi:hypothetical protein
MRQPGLFRVFELYRVHVGGLHLVSSRQAISCQTPSLAHVSRVSS